MDYPSLDLKQGCTIDFFFFQFPMPRSKIPIRGSAETPGHVPISRGFVPRFFRHVPFCTTIFTSDFCTVITPFRVSSRIGQRRA